VTVDLNIKIGGAAGQGIQTIGAVLSKTLMRGSFYVFGIQHYYSRVRGGHNYVQLRVSDQPIMAMTEPVNMLIALDRESIDLHLQELEKGVAVVDSDSVEIREKDPAIFHVPLAAIAKDVGGSLLFSNTVATGAALGLLCFDIKLLNNMLTSAFKKKGDEVVKKNVESAAAGYKYAQENYPGKCLYTLNPRKPVNRMLINGNEAVGLGALASGLKFLSAYPMTPSTGVMNYVAANADLFGAVVEQAEDEIAGLNMALGASFAGVRSMTTTSGGGFSLMVEAVGLAGMTETPIVIFLAQRPGPATGLPTMTEQGDLEFVLHSAQGEFTRCVLAPKSAEDAFYLTSKAFNIADKYQIPVFLLSDQYLADSMLTCEEFDISRIRIDRHLIPDSELRKTGEYKRYRFSKTGISPRTLPGQGGILVVADSDEHDEEGHIDESALNRVKMMDKRLRKLEILRSEMRQPEIYGPKGAETTIIGWGSTYGPLREAVDRLQARNVGVTLIHFTELYPLPPGVLKLLKKPERVICVEGNATGQFSRVLTVETGFTDFEHILKYDGRPFTVDLILRELKEMGVR